MSNALPLVAFLLVVIFAALSRGAGARGKKEERPLGLSMFAPDKTPPDDKEKRHKLRSDTEPGAPT